MDDIVQVMPYRFTFIYYLSSIVKRKKNHKKIKQELEVIVDGKFWFCEYFEGGCLLLSSLFLYNHFTFFVYFVTVWLAM